MCFRPRSPDGQLAAQGLLPSRSSLYKAFHSEQEIYMTKQSISRTFMIIAATLALGACAGNSTQRSTAQYTDDATINTNVQAAVISVPGVHANNIQVSTYEGVVTLRGNVDDQLAAQNAVQAARQVAGVKKVDYDIKVDQR
jgi:osmotically-inducible protein OsmY